MNPFVCLDENAAPVVWCHHSENPLFPWYAQGARCGHLEGAGRSGVYVMGEEYEPSWEAADAQGLSGDRATAWARGYRYGYIVRASGDELDADISEAPLPG